MRALNPGWLGKTLAKASTPPSLPADEKIGENPWRGFEVRGWELR